MSLEVPQAKTRHLVGDKNKPRRRKTEARRVWARISMQYRVYVCAASVRALPISEDRFIHSRLIVA